MNTNQVTTPRHFICTTGTSIEPLVRPDADLASVIEFTRDRLCTMEESGGREAVLRKACAELHSLWRAGANESDRVYLLHTDTSEGALCAAAVADAVRTYLGATAELHRIEGLQARDAKLFRDVGVVRLFATLDRLCEGAGPNADIRLNVSGGFKGIVPYVTAYGLWQQLPVSYLFEQSEELIELPIYPFSSREKT